MTQYASQVKEMKVDLIQLHSLLVLDSLIASSGNYRGSEGRNNSFLLAYIGNYNGNFL